MVKWWNEFYDTLRTLKNYLQKIESFVIFPQPFKFYLLLCLKTILTLYHILVEAVFMLVVWVNFQQLEPYSSKQVTVFCLKDESINKAARHRQPMGDNWSLKLVLCYCHVASQVVRERWLSFSLTVIYSWFGTDITRNRIRAHIWREKLHSFLTPAERVALNRDGLFPLEFCAREIKMHDSSFATWII